MSKQPFGLDFKIGVNGYFAHKAQKGKGNMTDRKIINNTLFYIHENKTNTSSLT